MNDSQAIVTAILCPFMLLLLNACQGEIQNPHPPQPPNLKEKAAQMLNPTGNVDATALAQLNKWILEDANLFTLVAPVLTESLVDMIKGITQSKTTETTMDTSTVMDASTEMEINSNGESTEVKAQAENGLLSVLDQFEGNGWMRLTISCAQISNIINQNQDITEDLGTIRLNILFQDLKIDPLIWGEAQACRIKVAQYQIDMSINGTIAYFMPVDQPLFDQSWMLAYQAWISFSGNLALNQHQYQGEQTMMLDQESKRLWLQWELTENQSLIISKAPELTDFANFDLQAANGIWHCDLANQNCLSDPEMKQISW